MSDLDKLETTLMQGVSSSMTEDAMQQLAITYRTMFNNRSLEIAALLLDKKWHAYVRQHGEEAEKSRRYANAWAAVLNAQGMEAPQRTHMSPLPVRVSNTQTHPNRKGPWTIAVVIICIAVVAMLIYLVRRFGGDNIPIHFIGTFGSAFFHNIPDVPSLLR